MEKAQLKGVGAYSFNGCYQAVFLGARTVYTFNNNTQEFSKASSNCAYQALGFICQITKRLELVEL